MYIHDQTKLSDGTRVLNFTKLKPKANSQYGSFCFGYIFDTLYIGDVHHAIIMNYIIEEEGKDWADLMTAPQRWGWGTNQGRKDDEGKYIWDIRFSTDDALQTPGLADKVLDLFGEYFGGTFITQDEKGFTTQDNYGQRTKQQYQGEPGGEAYCDNCDEYYDPEWESHEEEKCSTCGDWYCTNSDPDHEYNHPECETCGDQYDQNSYIDSDEHEKPYCHDCYEHFDNTNDDEHYRHDTSLSHRPTHSDLTGSIRDYIKNIATAKEDRYALINSQAKKYNMYRQDITPYVDMALNPFYDQGFKRPEDAAIKHYQEGINAGWEPTAARSQLVGWLMNYYSQQEAGELADRAIAEAGNQMSLFSSKKDLWVEQSEAIDRGINDITDYIVFARLAAMKLAGPPIKSLWELTKEYPDKTYGELLEEYNKQDYLEFPQGEFKRLPDPITPPATPDASTGLTEAPGGTENPYGYKPPEGDNPHQYNPEDLRLLDIEENPLSKEYRWSYDGHDLHIWQVTNRKMWGPSHYDMFGSEGYDEHSQGRVYVSPQGEVGSLYWQISHPECEDVINQWIQQTFGKPADTIYRAYGPYKGYKTPRSYFPLVDVYNLPIPKSQRWWEKPQERPDRWYYDNGVVPPTKKRQKPTVSPAEQKALDVIDKPQYNSPGAAPYKDLNKKERRRLRRQKNKGQGKPNRGRGRHGSINVISYEYDMPDTGIENFDVPVTKFVFGTDGSLKVADQSDQNYSGDIHHQDLWGDLGDMIMRGEFETPNNGFLTHQAMRMANCDLKPGDIWFYQIPKPEEIQVVKQHFGDIVKRIRWQELCDGADSF